MCNFQLADFKKSEISGDYLTELYLTIVKNYQRYEQNNPKNNPNNELKKQPSK